VDPHATIAKALESRPGDPIALSRQAFLDERDGNFEKAIGGYQASLQSSPAYVVAALKLATIYENHDSTQKAVELLKASRKLNPSDSSIAHSLGLLAFETRDYGWSVSLLQDAAFGQPDDPKILYDLAWSFYSVGRLNDALTSMRQALHQELPAPQAAEARRFLDMVDPSTANSESVVSPKNVEGILRIEPGYVPALMTLADIEANSNDPVSAAKTYGKVLEQYPDFAPAMRKLIIMDSEKPVNDPKAIEVAAKAGEAFPDDAELEKATGIIAFRTKDFSRAVNLLHMSEHEFVNDPELLYYLGMAQCRLDMRTEGNESLRRALKLNLRADLAAEAERVLALK
jgi:Flp pilus assembly protein TadD